uniref:Uncharacterized protein n=1 Tax=Amphiprion ocellaris TaxID=80972 RepID=A0A3Q1BHT4_AMPOC
MGRVLLVSHEVDLEDNITLRDVILMKWFNERREGPFEVVRSTGTAVQVKGSPTWYHLSHCMTPIPVAISMTPTTLKDVVDVKRK